MLSNQAGFSTKDAENPNDSASLTLKNQERYTFNVMAKPKSELALVDSVQGSNLPAKDKTKLSLMLDKLQEPSAQLAPSVSVGGAVVSGVEAGAVGGTLGLLHAELKDGLDVNGKPIDLMLASFAKAGAVLYGSERSNRVADVAIGICSFRKVEKVRRMIKEHAEAQRAEEAKPQAAE